MELDADSRTTTAPFSILQRFQQAPPDLPDQTPPALRKQSGLLGPELPHYITQACLLLRCLPVAFPSVISRTPESYPYQNLTTSLIHKSRVPRDPWIHGLGLLTRNG
jgi:hypothetical protein